MIFYFTATGNSKFIAEKIAAVTGERIIDITGCIKNREDTFTFDENESLGVVAPVYYYGLPMIVVEFLNKLKISANSDYYSYSILNCGGTTGNSINQAQKSFKFDAAFGIITVDNYIPMFKVVSDAEINDRLDKAEKEINFIIKRIQDKFIGTYNPVKGRFSGLLTAIAYPMYEYGRKTDKFNANDSCTGCSLCVKVCPREIIALENGKPVWKADRCEQCLGCVHRCPVAAINYGKKTADRGRYVNPRVKL